MKADMLRNSDEKDYRKLPILSDKQLKRFKELGCQCDSEDPIVVVKFFSPVGSSAWYGTEFDEERKVFYGMYVDNQYENFTMWNVAFIQNTKLPFYLRIERDKWFQETNVSKICRRLWEYRKDFLKDVAAGMRHKHDPFGYSLEFPP
jgi:hypothetical protein